MKNYKNLIPLALVLLMALGVYNTYDAAAQKQKSVKENLKLARECREDGVIQDALTHYQAVMEIQDDFSVELEVGEMLSEAEMVSDAVSWGENLVDKFPKEKEGYHFLLRQYIAENDYEECFELRDKAQNNECVNKEFAQLMEKIEYLYDYEYEEYEDAMTFSSGLAAGKKNEEWKLLDASGRACASGFLQVGFYNGEVIPVKTENGWMFATSDGNKKISVSKLGNVEELGRLDGNIFKAKRDGTYGYYDTELKKIAGDFAYASEMNEGVGAVFDGSVWKLADSAGTIGKKGYREIVLNARDIAYQNERIWVSEEDGIYYMIDREGNRIGKEEVEGTKGFTVSDSLAAVERNGKWGFMDKEGKMAIEPQYEDARSFCNEYAAVKQNGEWGFINVDGKMAIEPQFEDAKDFSDGSVLVQKGMNWVLLKLYRNNY